MVATPSHPDCCSLAIYGPGSALYFQVFLKLLFYLMIHIRLSIDDPYVYNNKTGQVATSDDVSIVSVFFDVEPKIGTVFRNWISFSSSFSASAHLSCPS